MATGTTTVDGIASGLDTTALIEAILSVSQVQLDTLEAQQDDLEDRQEAIASLSSKLSSLVDAMEALDEVDEIPAYSTAIEEEGYYTVETEADAVPGTYDIEVVQLATSHTLISDSVSDPSSASLTHGTLTIDYGDESYTVEVDGDNDSLAEIAEDLNDLDGISSYIMDTGDGYRLVISGQDTGEDYEITLSGAPSSSLSIDSTLGTDAQDAEITINGVTATSDSNEFEDVIPGITIDVDSVTTDVGAITTTIELDVDGLAEKVQTFIDAYNEVIKFYNTETVYNPDEGIRGGLVGESTADRIISQLGRMITGEYDVDGDINSFALIGFETETNGTITLDSDVFEDVIDDYYEDFIELLSSEEGPMTKIKEQIEDVYIDTYEGTLSLREDSLEESIENQEERIEDFKEYMESTEERLRDQFTYMETVLGELYSMQSYLSALFASATSSSDE